MKRGRARFDRGRFRGRCRRNLLAGLVLALIGIVYGGWGARQFGRRGADATAFDQPLVRAAARMVRLPSHLRTIQPQNSRELYLLAVVTDEQDVLFGLVVLMLRVIVSLTVGGLGLVLVTAGATEWEVRSETGAEAASSTAGSIQPPQVR